MQREFEMSLRDQLIAAQNASQAQDSQQPTSHVTTTTSGAVPYPAPTSSSPDERALDPTIAGDDAAQFDMNMHQGLGDINETLHAMANENGGGRRELSTSKRAAQNRAAQRAFRQRKEAYIIKLEKQVKDYRVMEDDFKVLQQENYQLREYILALQTRLLETSSASDMPPAPAPAKVHDYRMGTLTASSQLRAIQRMDQELGDLSSNGGKEQQPQADKAMEEYERERVARARAAPTANMAVDDDALPRQAIEQLQAAAAEAGQLGSTTG